jgi:serine/threonine-protein kinase
MRRFAILAGLAFAALFAREAAAADSYAAVAFSQATGASGYGYGFRTRAGAEERAMQECGPRCGVVMWIRNQCVAIAVGRGNGYGVYRSTSERAAAGGAMRECDSRTGDCQLRRVVCSAS